MSVAPLKRFAILDDYQGVALSLGPWDKLPKGVEITVFRDTITDHAALVERLKPFDAILAMRERTPFPRALIEALPNLRLIITTGGRNRSIDAAACAERGVVFCGTGTSGDPTADLTWGLILSLVRDIPRQQEALRAGRRVGELAHAFGMKVLAWSTNLTEERAAEIGATRVDKATLLREADVVTLHLILSDRSRNTITAPDLALMKPSAFIVNTSRGPLIEQAALIAALKEGRIAGAGLDVFDIEPMPVDHPILSVPNTVLTPHLGYVTEQNYRTYYEVAVAATNAFLAGAPIGVIKP